MQEYERLKNFVADMDGVLVAYSGGADSTLVAKAATDALGERAVCAIVESSLMAHRELEGALQRARELGLNLVRVRADLLRDAVAANPADRCYHCKKAVYQLLLDIARERNLEYVLDGSNADDDRDYRPGYRALTELGIRSPLQELGLGKQAVRAISRELGLSTWDKPASACLASRIPYGTPLTEETLRRIEAAENVLYSFGFSQLRVRHHGDLAKIELLPEEIETAAANPIRNRIVTELNKLGYTYVALDLAGYRTGSLNEILREQ